VPGIGVRVTLAEGIGPDALLFGESTGRVIVGTDRPEALLERARATGVPAARIGETGGDRLVIAPEGGDPWIDRPVAELRDAWSAGLPRRLAVS